MSDNKSISFTDLLVWKEAHKLVVETYKSTKDFPREEMYGITNQIRRCSVSVTSNIAEGFARRQCKDKLKFYNISMGSLFEYQNQILISKDIGYISKDHFLELAVQTNQVKKLLLGLIKSIEKRN